MDQFKPNGPSRSRLKRGHQLEKALKASRQDGDFVTASLSKPSPVKDGKVNIKRLKTMRDTNAKYNVITKIVLVVCSVGTVYIHINALHSDVTFLFIRSSFID